MDSLKSFSSFVGRILLSIIFILSALHKIFDWQNTETGMINLFSDWQSYVSFFPALSKIIASYIAYVNEILIAITIFELLGGFLLFFKIKEKFGAVLLIIYFIPATIFLHPFWFLSGALKAQELIIFLKNLAILGGLLIFVSGESQKTYNNHGPTEENIEV
ncbi:MAG: hypothetical protein A3F40_04960 [Chlamydiae bacterium RIFCSPHIGHO2_12_FULL_27_8]|nr:MAG: hypothetical protein A3F40_04960 [Chlamydiae bacterium RIFCSPHIGHO2_12_FULL_27_8]OGN64908.1 MAG: hypothetical protein A2888_03090 [Chlamydiae bacterium RIFCSPLOWO2_01_FULL_28_7]